jgi:hypothetical protein
VPLDDRLVTWDARLPHLVRLPLRPSLSSSVPLLPNSCLSVHHRCVRPLLSFAAAYPLDAQLQPGPCFHVDDPAATFAAFVHDR